MKSNQIALLLLLFANACSQANDDSSTISGAGRNANFKIKIKNAAANSSYSISCINNSNASNTYRTDTNTNSRADLFKCEDEKACNSNTYSLKFDRIDKEHASSGRCESAETPTLSGDGTFSATMYIHSNVQESDGVFTIAMEPEAFNTKEELDLIVVNVSEGVAKSGSPSKAPSVSLKSLSGRWIKVIMNKNGHRCTTRIERKGESSLSLGENYCNSNPKQNKIVINSRARAFSSMKSSSIEVANVSWTKR